MAGVNGAVVAVSLDTNLRLQRGEEVELVVSSNSNVRTNGVLGVSASSDSIREVGVEFLEPLEVDKELVVLGSILGGLHRGHELVVTSLIAEAGSVGGGGGGG